VSKGSEQILFIPIVGLQLKAYTYGGSKHQWNVTVGGLFTALRVSPFPDDDPLPEKQSLDRVQYVYAVQILYCLALYAAKLSILLQIKHIFEGTKQLTSIVFWASWATIALVTCAYIITTMLLVFSCTPVQKVGSLITERSRKLTPVTGMGSAYPWRMSQLGCRFRFRHCESHQRCCRPITSHRGCVSTADGDAQESCCLGSLRYRFGVCCSLPLLYVTDC
jgi:hypothetical protein